MNIIDKGRFEILEGFGQQGKHIFRAATTCYRSEDKTKRTADDFIKMLKSNKHLAMLEFSWFVLKIEVKPYDEDLLEDIYDEIIPYKYLFIDAVYNPDGGIDAYIVSGNGRAWLEFLQNKKSWLRFYSEIGRELQMQNPVIFDDADYIKDLGAPHIVTSPVDETKDEEHNWVAVKFSDVSRGFTHELVRHRVMSFAQASTRYISMEDFNFVFPQEAFEKAKYPQALSALINHTCEDIRRCYEKCLDFGLSKNEARQILPIGIANEICVAGRIKDWKHVFELRCAPAAHFEIREIMIELREEFKRRGLI